MLIYRFRPTLVTINNYGIFYQITRQAYHYQIFLNVSKPWCILFQIDLSVKLAYYLVIQLTLLKLFNVRFVNSTSSNSIPSYLAMMLTCSSSFAALANVPQSVYAISVCLTLLPQFMSIYVTFGAGFTSLQQYCVTQVRYVLDAIKEQGLAHCLEVVWERLRVPQVLRIFFLFRGCCVCLVVFSSSSIDMTSEGGTTPQGIFHYFLSDHIDSDDSVSSLTNSTRSTYLHNSTTSPLENRGSETNSTSGFYAVEHMAVMLTDSLLSVFSVGSVLSVPFYYCGVLLHDFVGGADLAHAESLGTVSAILFSLLAIQTGLTGLPPFLRLIRLYRNVCLHLAAVLHYAHDLIHPVLMSLSAQVGLCFSLCGCVLTESELFLLVTEICVVSW